MPFNDEFLGGGSWSCGPKYLWGEKEHLVTTDKLLLMSLNVGTFTFHVGHIISTYLFKQEQEQIGEQDVLNSHKQTAQKTPN